MRLLNPKPPGDFSFLFFKVSRVVRVCPQVEVISFRLLGLLKIKVQLRCASGTVRILIHTCTAENPPQHSFSTAIRPKNETARNPTCVSAWHSIASWALRSQRLFIEGHDLDEILSSLPVISLRKKRASSYRVCLSPVLPVQLEVSR